MEENHAEWLSHLSNEIVADAHGNLLDAYVVALEGWRRGLTLRWHVKDSEKFKDMITWYVDRPGQLFSLSSKEKTHYFFRTRGDKVSNEAVLIGKDKERTKQVLESQDVSVPQGKQFKEHETNEDILEYMSELGYPAVIKPTDGSFGRGVIANISSAGELEYSLDYVRNELGFKDIIVEEYVPGKEYRLYVVGDKVVGAMNRIPPNIVGDGINSIKSLIELKNEERSLNPRLVSCPIVINEEVENFIGRYGFTLDTVLETDKELFLSDKTNISLGGDPIDVFDHISENVKEEAVKAVQFIPGLYHGAVDLIVHENTNKVYIIEINPTAQLGGLLYPIQGKSRDIPKAIIDYYFPETKANDNEEINAYFDLHDVLEPLQSRDATTTTVTPCPQEKLTAKKYVVSGDVHDIGYHRGLRKHAFERYLHGSITKLEDGDIEIVVAGTDPEMVDDFKEGIWEDVERAQVIEVREAPYHEPVKVGFEIKVDLKTQVEELKMLRKELEHTEIAMKKSEIKRRKFQKSLSWKITSPIRLVGAIKKKMQ
ncbi:acylphosphatase [Oceanobacillus sp. FSL H7-0719]|uniref:acylphosphatase n=1 Tax=Oceanobacillus sp. FSL H7-0719 TaxID=2954507 RepID=UPI00324A2744